MRRKSRELALQSLFQAEFAGSTPLNELNRVQDSHEIIPDDEKAFALELTNGTLQNKEAIDALIQRHSAHWKVHRMATIDRNLLRLAIYEMKFSLTPLDPAIAINEALEIAKIYGGADSTSFINGLLDQVAKS